MKNQHDVTRCRACQNLAKFRKGMTIGEQMAHAAKFPNIHGSYAKGRKIK